MKNVLLFLLTFTSSFVFAQGIDVDINVLSQTSTKTVLTASIDEADLEDLIG